jgi:MFS superfamily sulfate permease-like transporter
VARPDSWRIFDLSGVLVSVSRSLPGVRALASYQRSWLRRDVVAGLVLTTLLVPQGMAYAELAGLPAITGLYTTILCLIAYAVFGPSRILVLGPDSSLGPMIAATILPILGSNGSPERAIALASMLALIVGAIMIAAGIAKLGFVADLLSKPTQIRYMNGLALTTLIRQLRKLFGFSTGANGLINEAKAFLHGLSHGEAVGAAVAIGVFSLVLILTLGRWLPRIPGVLVAVVAAIAASAAFELADHGVSLVGTLPKGFPPLTVPSPISDLPLLIAGALGLALVGLTDTISTASSFAARRAGARWQRRDDRDRRRERRRRFLPRIPGQHQRVAHRRRRANRRQDTAHRNRRSRRDRADAGTRARAVEKPPYPTLAAVVIAASLSLADVPGTVRLWRQRRVEFLLSITAFLGVALLGVLQGIAVAVALSILNVFRRTWWPYQTTLGRVPGMPGHHDRELHPEAEQLPGLVIFRFDAPLFFANARTFREQIRRLAAADPRPNWIVIAAEPITDVDTTAADMLAELDEELNAAGTSLVFAELKEPVRSKLERYELIGPLDPDHFFPTIDAAVDAFRRKTGADWTSPTDASVYRLSRREPRSRSRSRLRSCTEYPSRSPGLFARLS